jgi:hypothetical protein
MQEHESLANATALATARYSHACALYRNHNTCMQEMLPYGENAFPVHCTHIDICQVRLVCECLEGESE